ncbi:hypothetical protein HELRODRAFT_177353 [Helobdella robusta]|uniref:Uncharacterized protein n=1 Tax=Helobdella robusta TaxID=6412 RepID=T1FBJ9_HELRO|nr:hypothetical protein HELRODRAFT_177353 [Helobdella robusta]ESN98115.1 hypothetical protein HELRODRAFT_177353 [Helobdella robusta]
MYDIVKNKLLTLENIDHDSTIYNRYKKIMMLIVLNYWKTESNNGTIQYIPVQSTKVLDKGKEWFLKHIKKVDISKICKMTGSLLIPKNYTESYALLKKYMPGPEAGKFVEKVCQVVHTFLYPILQFDWKKYFGKETNGTFKNLDMQTVGDLVVLHENNLFDYTSDMLKAAGVPVKKIIKYFAAFGSLNRAIADGKLNINAVIGNIKNSRILNWKNLIRSGAKTLYILKNVDFKKSHFDDLKKALTSFAKTLSRLNMSATQMIEKFYGSVSRKFEYALLQNVISLNVKHRALHKILTLLSDNATLHKNPFSVTDKMLRELDVARAEWNTVIQRAADYYMPHKNVLPTKIRYRKGMEWCGAPFQNTQLSLKALTMHIFNLVPTVLDGSFRKNGMKKPEILDEYFRNVDSEPKNTVQKDYCDVSYVHFAKLVKILIKFDMKPFRHYDLF